MFKSIKAQIILLATVPLIGALALGGLSVYEKYVSQQRFAVVVPLIDVAGQMSSVIHELQQERGKTAAMIAGKYTPASVAAVTDQRLVADRIVDDFITNSLAKFEVSKKLSKDVDVLVKDLKNLGEIRSRVDGKLASVNDVVKTYSHVVHDAVYLIAHIAEMSPSEDISAEMIAFLELVEAKEAGGLERAVGAAMLNEANSGKFDFKRYVDYMSYLGTETAYLAEFHTVGAKSQVEYFDSVVTGPDVERVEELREILKNYPDQKDTKGLEGSVWFEAASIRLGLIKKVSDSSVAHTLEIARADENKLTWELFEIAGFAVALLLLSVGLAVWQIREITNALGSVAGTVTKLANGETPEDIPLTERRDPIGDIARASEVFRDNLKEREAMRSAQAGDEDARRAREDRVSALIQSFQSESADIQEAVNSNMVLLQGTASTLIETSQTTSQQSISVASASEEASSNVQTVAAAAEEMAASLGEINRQVSETSRVVGAATDAARNTNEKVAGLSNAAVKIGDVVSLIQDIAEQTNLLALNATIEAARAGDLGKGFAVVASEVKELANQTSKATGEIASQIGEIQSSTEESAAAIRTISEQMEEVNTYTNGISEAVEQQGIATQEITTNVQLAAQGTQEVAHTIVSISQATEETNRSANDASEAANSAVDQTTRLNSLVDTFLKNVAAA